MGESEIRDILKSWESLAKNLERNDPKLKKIIDVVGPPRPHLQPEAFEAIVCSVVGQQLAPLAARAILERLRSFFPPFPSPQSFLSASPEELRALGLSQRKSEYLKEISSHWVKEGWLVEWPSLENEAIVRKLTSIRGVGEWTAHMFLIFSLGRPNVLPVGDYGVRRAAQRLFDMDAIPDPKELNGLLAHWEGAYSVGSWYLWQGLNRKLL